MWSERLQPKPLPGLRGGLSPKYRFVGPVAIVTVRMLAKGRDNLARCGQSY
jgi:hypothetical protein